MAISLTISGGSNITGIPYVSGMNVQAALEAGYNLYVNPPSIPPLSFWIEFFGTYQGSYLGYLVTMMDGTAQQGTMYWMLYVNNTVATGGIDQTIVNDGDEIEFKYESYSDQLHGATVMKLVHMLKNNA